MNLTKTLMISFALLAACGSEGEPQSSGQDMGTIQDQDTDMVPDCDSTSAAICTESGCRPVSGKRFEPNKQCYEPLEYLGCALPSNGGENANRYIRSVETQECYEVANDDSIPVEGEWELIPFLEQCDPDGVFRECP